MTETKRRLEIEFLVEALDDVPDEAEGRETVERLGINVTSWTSDIRARLARAQAEARRQRFAQAAADYEQDLAGLSGQADEPAGTKEELQSILRDLVARASQKQQVSVNYHKFEHATLEELAEMIRTLKHLLDKDA